MGVPLRRDVGRFEFNRSLSTYKISTYVCCICERIPKRECVRMHEFLHGFHCDSVALLSKHGASLSANTITAQHALNHRLSLTQAHLVSELLWIPDFNVGSTLGKIISLTIFAFGASSFLWI